MFKEGGLGIWTYSYLSIFLSNGEWYGSAELCVMLALLFGDLLRSNCFFAEGKGRCLIFSVNFIFSTLVCKDQL